MIKRLTFLLLAAISLAVLGLLYRLNSTPATNAKAPPATTFKSSATQPESDFARHVEELKKKLPSTHKALIMNISTGGGTLVHEIVHPFVEANFPDCPPWLNEGLGSLYEQSGEVNGHIHGYTNWRLPGLQAAIKAGTVPSFKDLMSFNSRTFYDGDKGTNYGQSRYLCYYLQQRGLLVKYYREFANNRKSDPTGYRTLVRVVAIRDMGAFKRSWEKFVLGLQQGYDVTVQ